ncbi:uncharacterized protein LOC126897890 [Daktulosphaira vitifoliae]|uniref:uncharacterized protein LOC126897890 n=1 Tax=Daktulosphaira vitifoliae TaxID=58002 RepID=UPI0021AA2043|nr:uncharacterized protein LOC126897890 [Daktulosphaira vitifoliae]
MINVSEMFSEFFASNYSVSKQTVRTTYPSIILPSSFCIASCEIPVLKLFEELQRNTGTTYGPDLIPGIIFSSCCYPLTRPIHFLFSLSLSSGVFSVRWKSNYITPIFKSGDKSDVSNYRPISKLSVLPKIFEKLLEPELSLSFKNVLNNCQHGFRSSKSTITNLLVFYTNIVSTVTNGGRVDAIYTDMKKAFDTVNHKVLIDLSPLLFLIFMNDLSDVFQHSSYLCFADGVKIYSNIRRVHDSHNLQADLCRFYNWCVVNGLCLNVSKCAQITFSRKRSYELYAYNINSINLINIPHIKDLGVILSSDLSFTEHISFIYNKALRMLGFLKRNCWEFSNPICLRVIHFSLVRSIVEYGSIIWLPYQANLTNKL